MTNPEVPTSGIRFGLPSRDRAAPPPFGSAGTVAGMLVVALVVGGLVWSAAAGRPASAARPQLFTGSLVLEDTRPLTVINVATAQVTVRLEGVNAQVGAAADGDVQPVPVDGGTMLVNRVTGAFNFLDADNYVIDPSGPGVGLGFLDGATGAQGYSSGADAYIVRAAPASTVSLVGKQTVAEAARAQTGAAGAPRPSSPAVVPPLGFSSLGGRVTLQPGTAAASNGNLWVLVSGPAGCRLVELRPAPESRQGLVSAAHGSPSSCDRAALEPADGVLALATPGQVELFPTAGRPSSVPVPSTRGAARILPVTGASGRLWFLAAIGGGWELFGVGSHGRTFGPYPLAALGPSSDPVTPVLSAGVLYTLDQNQAGAPTLWAIDLTGGRMAPLRGASQYPVLNTERPSFHGAQVLLDGPRVVFNNPQSLEAVVVFTDGDHRPVIVDKSQAVAVSATGPADLAPQTATTLPRSGNGPASPTTIRSPVPVVQPVSRQITCAQTTQKPYAPQITGITPSSGAALIQWSYQLLDQTDCEPDTWAVQVRALTGEHQPAIPLQLVSGQDQYLFRGLRPATTYLVTVAAYINHQSTTSTPATFVTAARGPDAPLAVETRADGHGGWVVSWTPCTEALHPDCVVPANEWTVTGAACNGSFVGTPPVVYVPGGQDQVTVDAAGLKLLGNSLSFTVQGSLHSGLVGNPTSDGTCTEAYQPPDASAISVTGRGVEDTATGSITATLTIEATGDPNTVFGVQPGEAQFVYTLTGPLGSRTVGPTTDTSAVIPGLPPGVSFTPSVRVYPDGHPDAGVTVSGAAFQQTLSWPELPAPQVATSVDQRTYDQATVTVTLPSNTPNGPLSAIAPTSANTPGAGPEMQCGGSGGAVQAYPVQALSPARQLTFTMGDLVNFGGSCTVSFSLADGTSPDPYGGPSSPVTVPFAIEQPSYGFTFSYVGCDQGQCGPLGQQYTVEIHASDPFRGGADWSVTTRDPKLPEPADPCYSSTDSPSMPDGFDVQLPRQCVPTGQLTVTVQWRYLGQRQTVAAASTGAPPPTTTTTTTTTTVPPCTTTTSSGPATSSSPPTTGCDTTSTTAAATGAAAGAGLPAVALLAAWVVGGGGRKRKKEHT